jgi:hypothetical protein
MLAEHFVNSSEGQSIGSSGVSTISSRLQRRFGVALLIGFSHPLLSSTWLQAGARRRTSCGIQEPRGWDPEVTSGGDQQGKRALEA